MPGTAGGVKAVLEARTATAVRASSTFGGDVVCPSARFGEESQGGHVGSGAPGPLTSWCPLSSRRDERLDTGRESVPVP